MVIKCFSPPNYRKLKAKTKNIIYLSKPLDERRQYFCLACRIFMTKKESFRHLPILCLRDCFSLELLEPHTSGHDCRSGILMGLDRFLPRKSSVPACLYAFQAEGGIDRTHWIAFTF